MSVQRSANSRSFAFSKLLNGAVYSCILIALLLLQPRFCSASNSAHRLLNSSSTRFCRRLFGHFERVFCFVKSVPSWGVSCDVELSHVNVHSPPFVFGIPAISILLPVSSSSIACSIAFSFCTITIFLLACLLDLSFAFPALLFHCGNTLF